MQELMEEYQELHYYLAADLAGADDSMYDEEWLGFSLKAILKFCCCPPKRFMLYSLDCNDVVSLYAPTSES